MFNPCQTEACFDVTIYDDVRLEDSESFNFTVEMYSGRLGRECPIEPIRSKVIIHDNDGIDKTIYYNSVVLTLTPLQESKSVHACVCACVCVSDVRKLLVVTLPWTWLLSTKFFFRCHSWICKYTVQCAGD